MYSKAVYDYFNFNETTYKLKPKKISRTNAFKKKPSTSKTLIVPKKSKTCSKILTNSVSIEDKNSKTTQITENKSAVNVVYDTVQSIWKYAKSFISNQDSDSNRCHERLRQRNKQNASNRRNHSKGFRNMSTNTCSKDILNAKEEFSEVSSKVADDKKMNRKILPEETPTTIKKGQFADDIENVADFMAKSITDINFEGNTIGQKLINEKQASIFNKKNEVDAEENIPVAKTNNNKKATKIVLKPDLQNNQIEPENSNAIKTVLKSSLKIYGRGKRKIKKLHVHFKDVKDNEKSKYSAYKSKLLRKSDCVHPNYFYKKLNKLKQNKKMNEKKKRLGICTKGNNFLFKKRSKRGSSSNISLQSKLSTTKIHKREPANKSKKATANAKETKTTKHLKKIDNTQSENSDHVLDNDTKRELRSTTVGNELCDAQLSNIHLQQDKTTTEDDLFVINKTMFEQNNLLEFSQFLRDEQ